MSHNTPQENLEFQITFTQSNLYYLLDEDPQNEPLIEATLKKLKELNEKLKELNHENKTKAIHR